MLIKPCILEWGRHLPLSGSAERWRGDYYRPLIHLRRAIDTRRVKSLIPRTLALNLLRGLDQDILGQRSRELVCVINTRLGVRLQHLLSLLLVEVGLIKYHVLVVLALQLVLLRRCVANDRRGQQVVIVSELTAWSFRMLVAALLFMMLVLL